MKVTVSPGSSGMAAVSLPLLGEIQTLPALSVLAAFRPRKVMLCARVALVPNASGVPVAATVLIMLPNCCCAIVLNYGEMFKVIHLSTSAS